MDEKLFQKALREKEQLQKMGVKDAMEVIFGYHSQIVETLTKCMENVNSIVQMSPNTVALTDTTILIAERDVFDRKRGKDISCLAMLGSTEDMAEMFDKIFDKAPEVFEKLCEVRGYVKRQEEKTA